MNRRLLATVAVAALVTVLPLRSGEAGESVPFRGSGTAAFVEFVSENTALFDNSGHATHLGLFSGDALVEFQNGVPVGASITLYAAAGASVEMETSAIVDPETGEIVSVYAVTGGTGRFAGAEGFGRFDAVDNPDGTVSLSWDGDISF